MAPLTASPVLPPRLRPSIFEQHRSALPYRRPHKKRNFPLVPVARLFGPAIFEASKLKVMFLGVDEKKHPEKLPRTYTLTHSDITSNLTLGISHSINDSQLQGWYNRLQRDEVVAEWKKLKGKMSLHVHCHISGGHFLLDLCAKLRFFIFCKELPVVLSAFMHGDGNLLNQYPELREALVWIYFHSNLPEFNKVECWGPLRDAVAPTNSEAHIRMDMQEAPSSNSSDWNLPEQCRQDCQCCFPPKSTIPWTEKLLEREAIARGAGGAHQQTWTEIVEP